MKKIKLKDSSILVKPLKNRRTDFLRVMSFFKKNELSKVNDRQKDIINSDTVSVSCPFFAVNAGLTKYKDKHIYIGFTASKKSISKLAVIRNRSKRILRALINENIRDFDVAKLDFVFVAKKQILEASQKDLKKSFTWAIHAIIEKAEKELNL